MTIALVDDLPERFSGRSAAVIRYPDGFDLILIPRSEARVRVLDSAVRTLIRMRTVRLFSEGPRGEVVEERGVTESPAPSEGWAYHYDDKIQRLLDMLNDREAEPVRDFGDLPSIWTRPPNMLSWMPRELVEPGEIISSTPGSREIDYGSLRGSYPIEKNELSEAEHARSVAELRAELEVLIAEVEAQLPEAPDRDVITQVLRGDFSWILTSTPSESLSKLTGHALALRNLIWEKENGPQP